MDLNLIESFLAAGVALATPLLFAALGELLMEKSGVIDIALEGKMLAAAFFAVLVAYWTQSPALGLLAGMVAAVVLALLFAFFVLYLQVDQIIIGAGMNMLALGLTGVLYRELFGMTGQTITVPTFSAWPVPLLRHLPVLGRSLFQQNILVYLALLSVGLVAFLLRRTRFGLYLRAVGDSPAAADAAGVHVPRIRLLAILLGGLACGLAGAFLSIAHANTFVEGMTAGRGFIALAIVIFARWNPIGAFFIALLFGLASALQFQFQAFGVALPYQIVLMLPYILTLVVAALMGLRATPPQALARPYFRE
ncbi:MAG: ABC transporter permease [candidate division KSB1 bacterium]|nr:ABC transporter permease [candidate division KSB1 bacterium]